MTGWALDLGTTNTGVAHWDEKTGQPQLILLPNICRVPEGANTLEAPRLVPSAVHVIESPGFWARLGGWPPIARRTFLGHTALIGRPALERNNDSAHEAFAPTFKPSLERESLRPLARVGRRLFSAREIARLFLRELLVEVKQTTGQRIRDLVVTSPVAAFETYRAEVQEIGRALGIKRLRFLDEPVAAALGYGLNLTRERTVLVVDIGGGTMHVALVKLSPGGALAGQARVLGKQGRPYGGNAVDGWVLADVCRQMGYPLDDNDCGDETRYWRRVMLAEACRVKEAVFFEDNAAFRLTPPGLARLGQPNALGSSLVTLSKARLSEILKENGFFKAIEECMEAIFRRDDAAAPREDEVEEVLMVGGSTLLPGVFALLESRFGRRRLRAWQPFEAVAYGAACYAADRMSPLDFIVHDYAFVTHDAKTGDPQYTVIVPQGTRFPTRPDFWKRQVVPTCSLGEPETIFKLVICEIGRSATGERRFVYDASGDLHKVGGTAGENQVIVPLNESSPTLGFLDPPHPPGNRRPRLQIGFGVNAERWLTATVHDLLTRKQLMHEEPVVKLL
jgi:molecular chaperone DnaK